MKRVCLLLLAAFTAPAWAADPVVPLLAVSPGAGGQVIGVPGASLPWLLLFPFLPALLLAFTAFARIAVVLFLLRQGLGGGQTPPTTVLTGLALLLALFVMSPALKTIDSEAYQPYLAGHADARRCRRESGRAAENLHVASDPRGGSGPLHRGQYRRRRDGRCPAR